MAATTRDITALDTTSMIMRVDTERCIGITQRHTEDGTGCDWHMCHVRDCGMSDGENRQQERRVMMAEVVKVAEMVAATAREATEVATEVVSVEETVEVVRVEEMGRWR